MNWHFMIISPDFMRTEYDLPEYAQAMRDIHFSRESYGFDCSP